MKYTMSQKGKTQLSVTVAGLDFKFKNTRQYPIRLVATAKNGIATVTVYGIKEETEYLLEQIYTNFEVIILPDKYTEDEINIELFKDSRIRIIETGELPPAIKRAIGVKKSNGNILAFLDDDTYPEKDWLLNALRAMESSKVSALGGPAINTPKDNFSKQIMSSYLH